MSQVSIIDIESNNPQIPTSFTTDTGPGAIPIANVLEVLGSYVPAGVLPVFTSGSGNTVTVNVQIAQAIAASNILNVGLAAFDSASFAVDANGFVSFIGGGGTVTEFNVDASTAPGTDPVLPDGGGAITITGAQVAATTVGDNVIRTNSIAANSYQIEIQRSTAVIATGSVNNGVSHYDSADFTVDTNGFVQLSGTGAGQTITGDDANILSPTAGNWNILGQQASTIPVVQTNGSVSTLRIEDRTWITQFVVDASATVGLRGTFTTIQAAITAAVSGQNIFIRPGTYTENLTLKAGVRLIAMANADANQNTFPVTIIGKSTLTSGETIFEGIHFVTNSDFIFAASGGGSINCNDCSFLFDTSAGFSLDSGRVSLTNCNGIEAGDRAVFTAINSSVATITNCKFLSGSSTGSTFANGSSFAVNNSTFQNFLTTSNTASIRAVNSTFGVSSVNQTMLTINGTGSSSLYNCNVLCSGATSISIGTGATLSVTNLTLLTTNPTAISGAGTLNYCGINFIGTGSTITTTTQVPFVMSNNAVKMVTPGAYPYTTTPQDGVILVDTSSARTITPLASPTTGQMHRIKDSVGSAAANNITITPSGKNIDGAASTTININYGSVDIVYNGTEWSIL